jgi:hypothetical protein
VFDAEFHRCKIKKKIDEMKQSITDRQYAKETHGLSCQETKMK